MTTSHLSIRDLPSPNQDDRPDGMPVDMLILHYTDMESGAAAIARLRDPVAKVSSHYVVEEDGSIFRLVPEHRRAFHAGISHWRGHDTLNGRSIGVEVVNPGHSCGYRPFPALQMAALCDLCLDILARWPIPARNVVGHSDVAPDRKIDPGELFDWQGLAANGVGLWPAGVSGHSTRPAGDGIARALPLLQAIGYPVDPGRPEIVLSAFQRHWRQETVSGEADSGTLARIEAVAALCGIASGN
ncbi:Anhydro-N-acetylmuramyl-tripeptide amidase [Roseomonas mucosa]|uniref:N-acetylmuramoyl-L-alanine amidase n=1 Tax=Roseomonas TaxID=125216 RepID=UPI00095A37B4|nr:MULTISPECIES: N-acetylmuramoyl-L-alanine amidase [Roseomonas]ATR22906.1 N-acetylmuramoyl-L-alanine amidase [Roseomonas sp. FDAARGOS_362]MDT8275610.1 N-acetylmuramoyl-L-alanine amidase [Roseomonas mucosa]MDT8354564.1 N-acetylmuramoyl-L-alanine amidase [Roseomonas mucosa]USQ72395.1 N-acetylmuramoyl-L-alanine amidase [Roseomonas mucosa]UZO98289.1 Anhydro-N-acetylmuramyl-tripeptide amidase [Roseomonas mucosa]